MVYTLTLNPAIDYVLNLESLKFGETNRSSNEKIFFGGKGINVSYVLNELGVKNKALGFIGGSTGEMFFDGVNKMGINADFIKIKDGDTRINIKIKGGSETEINASGPYINNESLILLKNKLSSLKEGDFLVLSGSRPKGIPDNFYAELTENFTKKGVKVTVDTTGTALINTLEFSPFLIKPNLSELSEAVGKKLNGEEDIISACKYLKSLGAVNVMVTLGADGIIFLDEFNNFHKVSALKGKVINTVGAGDSTIAGFIYGYLNNKPYSDIIKICNACGGATSFKYNLAKRQDIINLL